MVITIYFSHIHENKSALQFQDVLLLLFFFIVVVVVCGGHICLWVLGPTHHFCDLQNTIHVVQLYKDDQYSHVKNSRTVFRASHTKNYSALLELLECLLLKQKL